MGGLHAGSIAGYPLRSIARIGASVATPGHPRPLHFLRARRLWGRTPSSSPPGRMSPIRRSKDCLIGSTSRLSSAPGAEPRRSHEASSRPAAASSEQCGFLDLRMACPPDERIGSNRSTDKVASGEIFPTGPDRSGRSSPAPARGIPRRAPMICVILGQSRAGALRASRRSG